MNGRLALWIVLGLILGAGVGAAVTRLLVPVRYSDTAPMSLGGAGKDAFREMIAAAYAADGDLGRASARLALLGDPSPVSSLAAQAQRLVAQGQSYQEARQLAQLAADLSTADSLPSTPTEPAQPSGSTGGEAAFVPGQPARVCDPALGEPLIQVEAREASGNPAPGAQAIVTWGTGEDTFVTGMKSGKDTGYGEFTMAPDTTYSLRLGAGGQAVNNLGPVTCQKSDGTGTYPGGWKVEFSQP